MSGPNLGMQAATIACHQSCCNSAALHCTALPVMSIPGTGLVSMQCSYGPGLRIHRTVRWSFILLQAHAGDQHMEYATTVNNLAGYLRIR